MYSMIFWLLYQYEGYVKLIEILTILDTCEGDIIAVIIMNHDGRIWRLTQWQYNYIIWKVSDVWPIMVVFIVCNNPPVYLVRGICCNLVCLALLCLRYRNRHLILMLLFIIIGRMSCNVCLVWRCNRIVFLWDAWQYEMIWRPYSTMKA